MIDVRFLESRLDRWSGRLGGVMRWWAVVALVGCVGAGDQNLPRASSPGTAAPVEVPCRPGGEVVACVGGRALTRDEFEAAVEGLDPVLRREFTTPNGKREFLRSLVDKVLLAQEARRLGLHEQAAVRRQVAALEDRLIVRALLAQQVTEPGEAALKAWFEEHAPEFQQPESFRLGRVLLIAADERALPALRGEARQLRALLVGGRKLDELAERGAGSERSRKGDLGWVESNSQAVPKAVLEVVSKLTNAGEVAPVVEVGRELHVVQLLDRRPARPLSFEEARGQVANRLRPKSQRQAFDRLVEHLRKQTPVEILDESQK